MLEAHTILLVEEEVVVMPPMAVLVGLAVVAHQSTATMVLHLEQLIQVVVELEFLKMEEELVDLADLVLWY
jgi:hypothetical protein